MKGTLEKRLFLICFVALTLTVAVNTGFSVETFRRQYREGILRRCNTVASSLKTQIEGVLSLGLPLTEITGLNERCQAITDNDPEIFYCLIEDPRGTVLYRSPSKGFDLAAAKLTGRLGQDTSILEQKDYGRIYDFALPLYDFNEQLAGRVRIGFLGTVLTSLTKSHLAWSLLILGGGSAAVFLLLIFFIRQDLVKPLRKMCDTATIIASGDFKVRLPAMATTELSTLRDALAGMATSLLQRDVELQNRYAELETANRQLLQSFERVEAVSAELGRSREMYRSLLDDASDAILVCDEDDRILIANKSAERFFGITRKRVEQQSLKAFLSEVSCQNLEAISSWYQVIRSGQAGDTEIRFIHPGERKLLIGWATGTGIVGRQGKRFVQIIIRDTTHEEEVRQQLEMAARELERLNQMKNSFLGLASHELKTPLTIIMGYVELLLTEMSEKLDTTVEEMLRHIGRASDRLAEIVRDMVDVSMLDNRTMQMISQELSINELVQHAVEQSRPAIQQRRQKLHLNLADNLPQVRCDRERIEQALGNVLGNAVKFTPDYGLIRVCTRKVMQPRFPGMFASAETVAMGKPIDELVPFVEISVIDSGIGIAKDEQEAIFDKFYEVGDVREHSTGKVSFKSRGAGLGLTIVKGVVAMHGGKVWVESPGYDPDRCPGSSFFILLPAVEEAPVA